jgi:TolB-like protein/tetratricopeptide (TPR) repeat protein
MASLIPGYEYDIFISYRQKDNKGDRWVSEFVDVLKTELESTFKEEVSVYFDINPHDGLLETHDVDASLKEKLKCAVFIPIISRTYCDPKSFAWVHEFKAFIKQGSEDQNGLKVRLPGGNVANRVLPVQIHELDADDRKLVEDELGGFLRAIEFIYKEPGVNRPLLANEDHPDNNLNKTFYRNQINKVANAIKEIITGLKNPSNADKEISKGIEENKSHARKNKRTKIISSISILFVLIVAGYFIYSKIIKPKELPEKSIAVLPFFNDSPNNEDVSYINGIMSEIIDNLSKLKDLSVRPRTSVEKYRNMGKPSIPQIGKELKVSYLVEGHGQKIGKIIRLTVQLIDAARDRQIWTEPYEIELTDAANIFTLQSQIAQAIASEMKAIITLEEKHIIEKIPTTKLTAYDFYERGKDELTKFEIDNNNRAALEKAKDLYNEALKFDSTFAQVYTELARVYWDKNYLRDYLSKHFQDSTIILCDFALTLDHQLSDAYTLKGMYYSENGEPEQAIEEFDKAINLNPNDWRAYREKGALDARSDFANYIYYLQKAISINRGRELPDLLEEIGSLFATDAGFPENARHYYLDKLKLDGDSASYYELLASDEFYYANFIKSIELGLKGYALDSTNDNTLLYLGHSYSWLGKDAESLNYYKKWFERKKTRGALSLQSPFNSNLFNDMHRLGYSYWQNGYKKEAEYCFDEQINCCNSMINLKRKYAQTLYPYYDLAGVYAFRGDKEKSYENLRIFNKRKTESLWMVMLIKTDPLFNSIRNEPEFQQIVIDVERKYKTEHERVRKWLEENGML